MTDDLTPEEEAIAEQARLVADQPDTPVTGAEGLPDSVPDGDAGIEE